MSDDQQTVTATQWFAWPARKTWEEVRVQLRSRDGNVWEEIGADFEYWMQSDDGQMCDDVVAFRIIGEATESFVISATPAAAAIEACIALCERMEADKSLPAEAGNAAWNLKVGMRRLRQEAATAVPSGDVAGVIQADREFAARWVVIAPENAKKLRAGEWDHHVGVQAAKEHRLAAANLSYPHGVTELRETLENVAANLDRVPFNDVVRARAVIEQAARGLRLVGAAIAETQATPTQPGTCFLCAGKCRGHGLADPVAWEPEVGSVAALARAKAACSGAEPA